MISLDNNIFTMCGYNRSLLVGGFGVFTNSVRITYRDTDCESDIAPPLEKITRMSP